MNPSKPTAMNGPNKVLNAPVHLGSMAANLENNVDDIKSIWVMQRDDNLVSYLFSNYFKVNLECESNYTNTPPYRFSPFPSMVYKQI